MCLGRRLIHIELEEASAPIIVSVFEDEGVSELSAFINSSLAGKIAAFAGASGVGKSSLMNKLFPGLKLDTGEISKKIERGKNTTRHCELVPVEGGGMVLDTPGFSLLELDGKKMVEIDKLNSVFKVNGSDILAQSKRLC